MVIGYLEPHRRAETAAQAEGLAVVPRRRVTYRDTDARGDGPPGAPRARARAGPDRRARPHERARARARQALRGRRRTCSTPGSTCSRRSTSSTSRASTTRSPSSPACACARRSPTPSSRRPTRSCSSTSRRRPCIERLRAGKVYPPERVPAALNNFFRAENLAALREVALRQVAERVEAHRLPRESHGRRDDRIAAQAAPQAVGERLLALITPEPRSQRIVRRAWRSAQRLGGELDLLWVSSPDRAPAAEEREQLEALRRLASVLGAHLLIEPGDDVVEVAARVARERGTTYLLMGVPQPARRARPPRAARLVDRLLRALPGVDVRIVADRATASEGGPMTIVLVVLAVAGRRGRRRRLGRARRPAPRDRAAGRPRPDPVPVRRARAVAARARRRAAPRARRGRHARRRAYLAPVPLHAAARRGAARECELALPLLEAVEQASTAAGVAVDTRIERGRTLPPRAARADRARALRPDRRRRRAGGRAGLHRRRRRVAAAPRAGRDHRAAPGRRGARPQAARGRCGIAPPRGYGQPQVTTTERARRHACQPHGPVSAADGRVTA